VRGRLPPETAGAFTTAANLVNELVEAQQQGGVRRVLARWMRYDLIALDEVGYVPLAEIGAEFLFQVIAERAERASLIVTRTYRFRNGHRCFRTQDCARRCWTESPIAPTSLRRALTPIASDEPWRCARRKGPEAATPAFLPPLRPKRAVLRTTQVSAPAATPLTRCRAENY